MSAGALTPRQQLFVQEYLLDLNATAAYKRAGYKAKGRAAENAASRMLGFVGVKAAIEKALKDRFERLKLTGDQVLVELSLIARANIGDFVKWGPRMFKLTPSKSLTRAQRQCLAEISNVKGNLKVKMHSKIAALRMLAQYHKLLTQKEERPGSGGGPIQIKTIVAVMPPPDKAPGDDDADNPEAAI